MRGLVILVAALAGTAVLAVEGCGLGAGIYAGTGCGLILGLAGWLVVRKIVRRRGKSEKGFWGPWAAAALLRLALLGGCALLFHALFTMREGVLALLALATAFLTFLAWETWWLSLRLLGKSNG
jgi:hypothetical protein